MKKSYFYVFIILTVIFWGLFLKQDTQKHNYIGVKSCNCHNMPSRGKQVDIWQKSKHASAFKTLKTEQAEKIAKEKGLKTSASESKDCLCCHVTGYGENSFAEKYDIEEGVTCESCHGAASGWKNIHHKKDKLADAIEAGLVYTKLNENSKSIIENRCKSCHNEKSPTYKEFKFDEFWAKIAHPIPQK
jgi:hypothetical protein